MEFIAEGFAEAFRLIMGLDDQAYSALWTTLYTSSVSVLIALAVGMPLGFLLGYHDFPLRRTLRAVVDTLMAVPTVVVGLIVFSMLTYQGPLGEYRLLYTVEGIMIGQTLLALPIVISLTATAVETLDKRLFETLLTLGANGWRMALTVLREARYAMLGVMLVAYSRVVAEVGIAMMIGGNINFHTRTLTTAIALETGKGEFALGIALGLFLVLIALMLNAALSTFKAKAARAR
ncbi:MAG: ABC transporter permease [Campylobacterales bacterium]